MVFQVASFPQDSPPKPCINLYSPPQVLHAPPISTWFDHPKDIGWGVQIIKFVTMLLSPFLCYVPLRSKYSQHPILKKTQPAFPSQCERPSLTSMQKTVKIIVSVVWIENRKHSLISICSSWIDFDLLNLFPNIWTLALFQTNDYLSLYCYFVLHSDLVTWPST
jgi:hypothetical protein